MADCRTSSSSFFIFKLALNYYSLLSSCWAFLAVLSNFCARSALMWFSWLLLRMSSLYCDCSCSFFAYNWTFSCYSFLHFSRAFYSSLSVSPCTVFKAASAFFLRDSVCWRVDLSYADISLYLAYFSASSSSNLLFSEVTLCNSFTNYSLFFCTFCISISCLDSFSLAFVFNRTN